jgi:hypothetical protein
VTFTVTPVGYKGGFLLSPHRPDLVNQTTALRVLDPGGLFVSLRRNASANPYTVTAVVPIRGEGGLESNRLIEAGTDYPQEIRDRYLPADSMGPASADCWPRWCRRPNGADSTPYEKAKTMETIFRRKDSSRTTRCHRTPPCVEENRPH